MARELLLDWCFTPNGASIDYRVRLFRDGVEITSHEGALTEDARAAITLCGEIRERLSGRVQRWGLRPARSDPTAAGASSIEEGEEKLRDWAETSAIHFQEARARILARLAPRRSKTEGEKLDDHDAAGLVELCYEILGAEVGAQLLGPTITDHLRAHRARADDSGDARLFERHLRAGAAFSEGLSAGFFAYARLGGSAPDPG